MHSLFSTCIQIACTFTHKYLLCDYIVVVTGCGSYCRCALFTIVTRVSLFTQCVRIALIFGKFTSGNTKNKYKNAHTRYKHITCISHAVQAFRSNPCHFVVFLNVVGFFLLLSYASTI